MRIWTEILGDLFALVWNAIRTPKGIELLDELAQVLGLPDVFPNVDGLQSDDKPADARSGPQGYSAAYSPPEGVRVRTDTRAPEAAKPTDAPTAADIFGRASGFGGGD